MSQVISQCGPGNHMFYQNSLSEAINSQFYQYTLDYKHWCLSLGCQWVYALKMQNVEANDDNTIVDIDLLIN